MKIFGSDKKRAQTHTLSRHRLSPQQTHALLLQLTRNPAKYEQCQDEFIRTHADIRRISLSCSAKQTLMSCPWVETSSLKCVFTFVNVFVCVRVMH